MNLSVQTWMTMVTLLQKTGKTEKASDRIDERMKKYHAKGHKVFVIWEKQKVKSKSKKHVINVGTILKRYKDGANYDVNCDEPVSYNEKIKSWGFSWKPKKRQIKSKEKPQPLFVALTYEDRFQPWSDQGYDVHCVKYRDFT